MPLCIIIAAIVALGLESAATAQHQHAPVTEGAATSALTAEAVQQLLNGEGMGLARAAELNGYPGPKHVLEFKDQLGISSAQEKQVERIREQMLNEARSLGRSIVDAERSIDEAFMSRQISEADLASRTSIIARLQGELRRVHLQAHLLTRRILTDEQVKKYYELRKAHH